MSVKLIQNFEYLENFSLNGNAAISPVHKFGHKSVAFSGADDYISVSNNSGIFNINSESVRNFECFFKPYYDFDNNNNGYHFFNGHSFKFFSDNSTWKEAKSFCEARSGHLATSTSQDKNNFLNSMTNGNHTWLGATDELNEGTWVWVTGEEWNYSNWNTGDGQPNNAGGNQYYLAINDRGDNGLWDDTENDNALPFICEWDADFRSLGFIPGYIFNFDNGLSLMLNHDAALRLLSEQANIDVASTTTVAPDSWHHLSLSFHNSMAYVYLDGNLVLSAPFMNINFSPTTFSLGSFSGYIDEFAVRDDYDAPTSVPARQYETFRCKSSAPVKFALWSCNNLPDGLTLSQSGLLDGTPTAAGTFNCNVSLNTNWGTANKSIRIVIQ